MPVETGLVGIVIITELVPLVLSVLGVIDVGAILLVVALILGLVAIPPVLTIMLGSASTPVPEKRDVRIISTADWAAPVQTVSTTTPP